MTREPVCGWPLRQSGASVIPKHAGLDRARADVSFGEFDGCSLYHSKQTSRLSPQNKLAQNGHFLMRPDLLDRKTIV